MIHLWLIPFEDNIPHRSVSLFNCAMFFLNTTVSVKNKGGIEKSVRIWGKGVVPAFLTLTVYDKYITVGHMRNSILIQRVNMQH